MRKLVLSVAAGFAFVTMSSSAWATCVATGEITRLLVAPGSIDSLTTTVWVRSSAPGSLTLSFTTGDPRVTSAASAAQAGHERVTIAGGNGVCTASSLGLATGGNIISITVAPES